MRTHPLPRAEKVRLERAIDEKKDAKDESFLLIFQRTLLFTENISFITVHVIDQYLSRPISGPNTIMRKGQLEVVFLDSVFLKTLR